MTLLDVELLRLIGKHPDWRSYLSPVEADLVEQRLAGKTLQDLAAELHLTRAAVRLRLYGAGTGRRRHGGIWGRLKGLEIRERRFKTAGA